MSPQEQLKSARSMWANAMTLYCQGYISQDLCYQMQDEADRLAKEANNHMTTGVL
jgi:hypothetical protein